MHSLKGLLKRQTPESQRQVKARARSKALKWGSKLLGQTYIFTRAISQTRRKASNALARTERIPSILGDRENARGRSPSEVAAVQTIGWLSETISSRRSAAASAFAPREL